MDIQKYLEEKRELVDSYLERYFYPKIMPEILHSAMTYSLFAGGKRIRPVFSLMSYECLGENPLRILPQASSLELIHTYSLIHDDLPAMDNDDMRRGKPTNHRVYGEAMAILAGDGLLTEAFNMLTTNEGGLSDRALLRAVKDIAQKAGLYGMVAGQAQDILSENSEPDKDTLEFIHSHKTAALITASLRLGPILAESDDNVLSLFTGYGNNIGMIFQIIDDILDLTGDPSKTGKPTGSDEKKKKLTYPRLYGLDRSRQKARELVEEAIELISGLGKGAEPLKEVALYLLKRSS
ncbi:MAG: polyprenyl synthetase family protein [Thermodesulfovibrionales bacterium]